VLDVAKCKGVEWWDARRGNGPAGAINKLKETVTNLDKSIATLRERLDGQPPYPQCFYDKQHFDRIKQIEEDVGFVRASQEEQRRMIDKGNFTCKVTPEHLRAIDRIAERG
jgi:hypothetical protein